MQIPGRYYSIKLHLAWVAITLTLLVPSLVVANQPTSSHSVTAEKYGEKWPFIADVKSGKVECHGSAALFNDGVNRYALNGVAKSRFDIPYVSSTEIIKKVSLSEEYPEVLINADTEILRKLCG